MKIRILLLILVVCINVKMGFAVSNDNYLFINDVALEPSGERYWVGTNDAIYQLDAETHEILQTIEMPGPVKLLDVSPDGQKIAAGGELVGGASPAFYELRNIEGGLITSFTGDYIFTRPVFSQTSQKFIVLSRDENRVRLYDCQTGGMVMETINHDEPIKSAAVYTYGAENQFELLYVFSTNTDDEFNYKYLYKWDVDDNIQRGVSGRFSLKSIFTSYNNQQLSVNGTYLAFICYYRGGQIDTSYWYIFHTAYLNHLMSKEFGVWGSSISSFSDDEAYFWAVNQGLGNISIQELSNDQNTLKCSSELGQYELMADLCTIDQKPVMIVLYQRYSDNQYLFAMIDIETGERISESPPIAEMFQDSNIESWMVHE